MAGSLNKVQIIGNLGKDPEVRTMASGTKVANLSIATSETWNDKQSGERKERTEWHRVSIYNERLAEVAEKYLTKGRKVYIEGALETRKYTDNNGDDKYTTEVVLRNFRGELVLLDSRQDGDDDRPSRGREEPRGGGGREGGREDRGRDGRAAPRSREEPRGGGHEDWGRDSRRASNGSGRDAPRGRDDDRRGGAPAWDAKADDLNDEIPF